MFCIGKRGCIYFEARLLARRTAIRTYSLDAPLRRRSRANLSPEGIHVKIRKIRR
jgi:hypothetical protein